VPRVPLTACIITRDEQRDLPACLESVSFADEIVVVDSHSTDSTRDLAAAFRGKSPDGDDVIPRVIERDWPGHVEQKNFAIGQASHDWVLCVDADERVSPMLREEILAALSTDAPAADGYLMPRKTFYLGRWITHGGWYPDRKLRLFRRSRGRWGGINPHDHVRVEGRVGALRGDLHHFSYRSISDHLRTIDFFTTIAAREKSSRGVRIPVLRMLVQPPFKFLKSYLLQQGFREGVAGLVIATLGAYYVFLKYAKLWELQRSRRSGADSAEDPR
jgi:glycosyltransferase involved in cell wall biosynthesis